jgi:hypothetical protein
LTRVDEKIRTSDLPNPRGQRDGGDYGFEHASVPIPKVPGWAQVLRQLKGLAVQDDRSFAWLLRSALLEYYDHHWPGNPVPRIENYVPGGLPFSEAAKEKLSNVRRWTEDRKDLVETAPMITTDATPDFNATSDAELLEMYRKAIQTNDYGLRQLARYHINKRGLRP